MLHLVLASNVRVKSIWKHNAPPPGFSYLPRALRKIVCVFIQSPFIMPMKTSWACNPHTMEPKSSHWHAFRTVILECFNLKEYLSTFWFCLPAFLDVHDLIKDNLSKNDSITFWNNPIYPLLFTCKNLDGVWYTFWKKWYLHSTSKKAIWPISFSNFRLAWIKKCH